MRNKALNVLAVDDNPVLVSVLSEIFHECGHNVRVVSDGFFALAEIRNRVPDVLLSDLSMSEMSGYELLSAVRHRFPAIRVMAMSGCFSGESVPAGVAADAFYAKGESSLTQLIQVAGTIGRDDAVLSRSLAPVWISEIFFDYAGSLVLLASCPECLRPFPNRFINKEMQRCEKSCPHCMMPIELAFVRQPTGMDGTPISLTTATIQKKNSAFESRLGGGTSTGRMTHNDQHPG